MLFIIKAWITFFVSISITFMIFWGLGYITLFLWFHDEHQ